MLEADDVKTGIADEDGVRAGDTGARRDSSTDRMYDGSLFASDIVSSTDFFEKG